MSKDAVDARTSTGDPGLAVGAYKPITDIEYAEDIRFKKPVIPQFSVLPSLCSIASLCIMASMAYVILAALLSPGSAPAWFKVPSGVEAFAVWTWLPFAFTLFGASLGAAYEAMLLLKGSPFQLNTYPFIQQVRFLNVAPVLMTIFAFVVSMTIADTSLRTALLFVVGFVGSGAALAAFFGGAVTALAFTLMSAQVIQIIFALTMMKALPGVATASLIGASILQLSALRVGTATPAASTGFHLLSTGAGVLLFVALLSVTKINPDFSNQVAIHFPNDSLMFWGFIAACIAGVITTAKTFPRTYNNWRSITSNALWSVLYFFLVSQDRFPKPFNLTQVYGKTPPKRTELRPYYLQHPDFLPQPLSIPAAEQIEGNVSIFKALFNQVQLAFKMISVLDHYFPQAKADAPLKDKPRLEIWSSGENYWPTLFTRTIFGHTIPGKTLERTPDPAIQAFKQGQLLAYLCESGVGSTFLRMCESRGPEARMIDFRFLEKYATKPDYEPYGGMAFFTVNSQRQRLELVSVVAPGDKEEISANPHDPSFRHAESMILASLYYQVISGKHLAEIHMTHNLVEVAMHNAFDVQGQYAHPFRTFMYLHLFSHELAEELTTEHLVQEGAVFNQIFATTQNALIDHLNDTYSSFQYGEDEDFEGRAAIMRMRPQSKNSEGELLPHSAIRWELEYFTIWTRYTTGLIDAIYANDAAVQKDKYLQDFWQELNLVMLNALPERYNEFKTKKGVARWAADTIHHLVIRHQVYGTTGVRAALDPRINTTQVPRDGGTPGVMEWRSLACVALATARSRFVLLMNDFTYLLDGVDVQYKPAMKQAFDRLQTDLKELNQKWTATDADRLFNYDYFRAVPSDIHTGPGY